MRRVRKISNGESLSDEGDVKTKTDASLRDGLGIRHRLGIPANMDPAGPLEGCEADANRYDK